MEATPKHLIIVDGAILQPIPEHPKRDFIFCLSTAFGDAYLFQVREHQMNYRKENKVHFRPTPHLLLSVSGKKKMETFNILYFLRSQITKGSVYQQNKLLTLTLISTSAA